MLREELIETVGIDRARRILMRFGYACGYRDALTTKDWQAADDLAQMEKRAGTIKVRPVAAGPRRVHV